MTRIVLPNARRYARSTQWAKRYLACQSFQLSKTLDDEPIIKHLIADRVPIVSIHAALVAVKYDSQSAVDAVISVFAKGRRIQQSLYAQFVSKENTHLVALVVHRLRQENDPYVKAFCYRMLSYYSSDMKPMDVLWSDVQSNNIELRIAAMVCLSACDPQAASLVLLSSLQDKQWEIRAKSAKLLGEIGAPEYAVPLAACLHDEAWWVRVCAAEALIALGDIGVSILQNEPIYDDPYAHDSAVVALSRWKRTKHE